MIELILSYIDVFFVLISIIALNLYIDKKHLNYFFGFIMTRKNGKLVLDFELIKQNNFEIIRRFFYSIKHLILLELFLYGGLIYAFIN